jgi:hypothetical protein
MINFLGVNAVYHRHLSLSSPKGQDFRAILAHNIVCIFDSLFVVP